jgi:hypothetical protein
MIHVTDGRSERASILGYERHESVTDEDVDGLRAGLRA